MVGIELFMKMGYSVLSTLVIPDSPLDLAFKIENVPLYGSSLI